MQCRFSIRHEVLPDVNCQLRGFDDNVCVLSQILSPVHGFSVFRSTDQIVHHLRSTAQDFPLWQRQVDTILRRNRIAFPKSQIHSLHTIPFVSSAYLPPPRGTLTGMFNVWSLTTAKASCTRSPWVIRVNGMSNALVWSFALRDMSNEVWVSALSSLLFIKWCLCIDGVDWLFLFVSSFQIGSFFLASD